MLDLTIHRYISLRHDGMRHFSSLSCAIQDAYPVKGAIQTLQLSHKHSTPTTKFLNPASILILGAQLDYLQGNHAVREQRIQELALSHWRSILSESTV